MGVVDQGELAETKFGRAVLMYQGIVFEILILGLVNELVIAWEAFDDIDDGGVIITSPEQLEIWIGIAIWMENLFVLQLVVFNRTHSLVVVDMSAEVEIEIHFVKDVKKILVFLRSIFTVVHPFNIAAIRGSMTEKNQPWKFSSL